ncbi:hypothetical protein [Burkholderia cepacia]|uniref:hypothetical protein n=1 Tax=Burkholderia cepacia TaxID=292 RepID=UPI000A9EBB9A|nr:hypothetical protein [Burkholderia cepacia]HDR9503473.1 hypothetical protein [Burkholderia cepacia]
MKGVGHEAQRAHFPSADVAARGRSQELHLSLMGRFRVTALAYGKQLRKAAAGQKGTVDIDARIVDSHISASTRTFVPNTPSTTQSISHDKQHASVDNRNDPFGEMPLQQHCFAAFVATSVTLIFAIPAHDCYRLTQAFDRESTVVNGRVIRFQQGQNGNLSPVVAYSFEGRSYEHPVPSKDGRYNMDALRAESFRVRLLKSSPEVALVSNWEQPPVYWPLATIAGAAGFVSSCLLLSLLRRVVQRFI